MKTIPLEFFSWAKELAEYSRMVWALGYTKANGGNLSLKIAEDLIMTTPTMMSKGELTSDDMVVCNLKGDIVFGYQSPSSEIYSHLAIYNANENAKAVVHSHAPYSSSFAFTEEMPHSALSPDYVLWLGEICEIPFLMPGSKDLSNEIGRLCKDKYVLLMRNHGLITWGQSLQSAVWRTEVMENYCMVSHLISSRGASPAKLTTKQIAMLEKLKGGFIK